VAITPSHQSCIETLDVVLQSVFRAGEIIAFNRVEQKAGPFFLFFFGLEFNGCTHGNDEI